MDGKITVEAKKKAAELYKNGISHCSEAILYTINELMDRPLSEDKIKLVSALPVGLGYGGCFCGALSGGIMAFGLLLGGSSSHNEKVNSACMELQEWFKKSHDYPCCRNLNKNIKFLSTEHREKWGDLTGEVAEKTMELILKYSISKKTEA